MRRLPYLTSDLSQDSVSSTLLAHHSSGMASALRSLQSFTASEASTEEGSRQCTALESTRWDTCCWDYLLLCIVSVTLTGRDSVLQRFLSQADSQAGEACVFCLRCSAYCRAAEGGVAALQGQVCWLYEVHELWVCRPLYVALQTRHLQLGRMPARELSDAGRPPRSLQAACLPARGSHVAWPLQIGCDGLHCHAWAVH